MSIDKKIYAGNQDELELLALELSELKGILRELSQQVLRIERRVKAALPAPQGSRNQIHVNGLMKALRAVPSIVLRERARHGEQIESELSNMTVKNELVVMARELG